MNKFKISVSKIYLFILPLIGAGSNLSSQEIPGKYRDKKQQSLIRSIDENIDIAVKQYQLMGKSLSLEPGRFPRTVDENGQLVTCSPAWWTSGFFPGSLWLLYGETRDNSIKKQAEYYSSMLEKFQYSTDNHDIGWIINSSFGNGYKQTKDKQYSKIIIQSAKTLITRFNPSLAGNSS